MPLPAPYAKISLFAAGLWLGADSKPKIGGQAVLNGVMMRSDDCWTVAVRTQDGALATQTTPHRSWTKKRKLFGRPMIRGAVVLLESLVIGFKALNFSAEVAAADIDAQEAKAKEAKAKEAAAPAKSESLQTAVNDVEGVCAAKEGARQDDNIIDEKLQDGNIIDDNIMDESRSVSSGDSISAQGSCRADDESSQAAEIAPENSNSRSPQQTPAARQAASIAPSLARKPKELDSKTIETKTIDPETLDSKPKQSKSLGALSMIISLLSGLLLAVALFVALPHFLSVLFGRYAGFNESNFSFHILDGLLKFGIFLAYVWAIGLIPEIGRVYAYHGAEHKAIHVLEAGLALTADNARPFPTWHPRCGTAFIFLVLAFSILFFAILFPLVFPFENLSAVPRALAGVGIKTLLTLPLAAFAYEITRLAGRPKANVFWRTLVWPGLMLQKLTTRQPDDSQLEVAFCSLLAALNSRPSNTVPTDSVPPCPSI
ncbi:MAG: DUF1385 domain-containing protein [Deltaproteobacteria bacterium]|jgi:uncharacterized protein YqhQ|nr:DUF1385 domain-containing protein [Deltaproteobacteria bacterium]